MGFTSHQQMHGEPSGRNVECSHFSRQHYGGRSAGKGSQESAGPEFLCLGDYLAPPRQVGGFVPRDALGRNPSADPRRWRTAGGPVAGAQLTCNTSNLL